MGYLGWDLNSHINSKIINGHVYTRHVCLFLHNPIEIYKMIYF